jgi:hypothetical protein
MAQNAWERRAPLTGLVFVVITVAVFAIGGDTPNNHDSAAQVAAFYSKHHDKHATLAFILALAVPFLVFFVSTLRHDLRRAGGTGQLANAAFAGGTIAAVGFGILSFIHFALADAADSAKTLGTTQVLNVLDSADFIPMATGMGILVLASGWSIVRHGPLPTWLGWAGIVIGVAIFTPAGFFGFLASGLWIVVASIMLTQIRHAAPGAPATPPAVA